MEMGLAQRAFLGVFLWFIHLYLDGIISFFFLIRTYVLRLMGSWNSVCLVLILI